MNHFVGWFSGILGAVIAGLIVFNLTEGRVKNLNYIEKEELEESSNSSILPTEESTDPSTRPTIEWEIDSAIVDVDECLAHSRKILVEDDYENIESESSFVSGISMQESAPRKDFLSCFDGPDETKVLVVIVSQTDNTNTPPNVYFSSESFDNASVGNCLSASVETLENQGFEDIQVTDNYATGNLGPKIAFTLCFEEQNGAQIITVLTD